MATWIWGDSPAAPTGGAGGGGVAVWGGSQAGGIAAPAAEGQGVALPAGQEAAAARFGPAATARQPEGSLAQAAGAWRGAQLGQEPSLDEPRGRDPAGLGVAAAARHGDDSAESQDGKRKQTGSASPWHDDATAQGGQAQPVPYRQPGILYAVFGPGGWDDAKTHPQPSPNKK
jgi:hypothetical protein